MEKHLDLSNHIPGNSKPEMQVQAFLIAQAITSPANLVNLLCCQDFFEELTFVDDEFSVSYLSEEKNPKKELKIRGDVLLLGRRGKNFSLVFVELKNGRQATTLQSQLNNINIAISQYKEEVMNYLSAATGILKEKLSLDEPKMMIIWPKGSGYADKPHPNTKKMLNDGVIIVEFSQKQIGTGTYSFARYTSEL